MKINGSIIIKGSGGYRGRPLAKGKFWEIHTTTTTTTKPPGVSLVDMVMYEEISNNI
jgi:hypothetical protein